MVSDSNDCASLSEHLLRVLGDFGTVPHLWVAFSGGLDSTVLLHALAAWRERLPGPLGAIHVDHGLHPDSGAWCAHCAAFSAQLRVPFHFEALALQVPPGASIEAVARTARYRCLARRLGPGELLLSAQHRDDQAETFLLAALRGSGPAGLAAMPVEAPLGAGRLLRPLLGQSRATLHSYARAQGLDWLEDPSNGELAFDRNFLRARVLPLLAGRWPTAATTLARSAAHCAEAAGLIERDMTARLASAAGRWPGTLAVAALDGLDAPARKALLRVWIRRQGFLAPDHRHLQRILDEVLSARADATPLVAWTGCEIRRYRGALFALAPLPPPPRAAFDWRIAGSDSVFVLPNDLGQLRWRQSAGRAERLFQVRFAQTPDHGARLTCLARLGATSKTLKKLYQQAGVPAWLRPYVPLLFERNAQGREELIALAGLCRCRGRDVGASGDAIGGDELAWLDPPWPGLLAAGARALGPGGGREGKG